MSFFQTRQHAMANTMPPAYPRLPSSAFCCCQLGTGALVIGVLSLLLALSHILALGTALAAVVWLKVQLENGQLMKDYKEELNKWFFSVIEEEDVEIAINATIGVLVVATLASLAYLVVSSLLIHGARRCREGLLTPWIIFALIFVVSNIINIIVCFIHE